MAQQQAIRDQYIEWLRRSSGRHDSQPHDGQIIHAWDVARQAARLLGHKYDVTRVRAFGSLVHPGSDVDLAAEGLSHHD